MADKSLRRYLLWSFGLAWPIQIAASVLALHGQAQYFRYLLLLVMLMPALAVLLARIPLRDMGWKPALRGKWRWFFAAWLGPALLGSLGAILYFVIFPSRLDTSGAVLSAQLGEAGMAQMEASGMTLNGLLLSQIVSALTAAPFLNILPSLGEEIGWRGAMYPRLRARFGSSRGRLLGGLIWGAWHWPVIVLAGYEYGLQYFGAPVLGPLLFCLITVGMGTLLDLVYEKSGCIWLPALGHGAINAFAAVPLLFLDPAYGDQLLLGPLLIGVIGGLPMLLLTLFVLLRGGKTPGVSADAGAADEGELS